MIKPVPNTGWHMRCFAGLPSPPTSSTIHSGNWAEPQDSVLLPYPPNPRSFPGLLLHLLFSLKCPRFSLEGKFPLTLKTKVTSVPSFASPRRAHSLVLGARALCAQPQDCGQWQSSPLSDFPGSPNVLCSSPGCQHSAWRVGGSTQKPSYIIKA